MSKSSQDLSDEIRRELELDRTERSLNQHLVKDEVVAVADALDVEFESDDTAAQIRANILHDIGRLAVPDAVDTQTQFRKVEKRWVLNALQDDE